MNPHKADHFLPARGSATGLKRCQGFVIFQGCLAERQPVFLFNTLKYHGNLASLGARTVSKEKANINNFARGRHVGQGAHDCNFKETFPAWCRI